MSMSEAAGGRRRWGRPRRSGVLVVVVGLVLLTACSSSPGSSPGATASRATASGTATAAAYTARLAYARCMRAHGVPTYPDPESNGQEPAGTKQLYASNPRISAAGAACRKLLPNAGQPTATAQPNALSQASAVSLAGCMRSHGYPAFPDPSIDSVGQPVFNLQAAGINSNSPQVLRSLRTCLSLLHITGIPQVSS